MFARLNSVLTGAEAIRVLVPILLGIRKVTVSGANMFSYSVINEETDDVPSEEITVD